MKRPYEVGLAAALALGGHGYGQGSRGDAHRSVIHTAAARWRGAAATTPLPVPITPPGETRGWVGEHGHAGRRGARVWFGEDGERVKPECTMGPASRRMADGPLSALEDQRDVLLVTLLGWAVLRKGTSFERVVNGQAGPQSGSTF